MIRVTKLHNWQRVLYWIFRGYAFKIILKYIVFRKNLDLSVIISRLLQMWILIFNY